jgi:hypothetical protein
VKKIQFAAIAVLVATLAAAPSLAERASAYLGSKPTPCGVIRVGNEATAQLQVVGDQMRDSHGKRFMPYGISVVSGPQTINWAQTQRAAVAQIVASQRYWHANTVRLQVSESLLFDKPSRGRSYNVRFAHAVDRLICRIVQQREIPVLNDTTIFTTHERGPVRRTVRFWRFMSHRYGNKLPIVFDLFNEPKVTMRPHSRDYLDQSLAWRLWRSGGKIGGARYLGMQDLVDEIRIRQGVSNLIWVEEPYYLEADVARLDLLPRYRLQGAGIVYAFHKPDMRQASRSYRGVRAAATNRVPLVDSEWGQFAATDRPWMCQSDAYRTAPAYLRFLRRSGVGMLAWSLQPGSLVKGVAGRDTVNDGMDFRFATSAARLRAPSVMKADYGCTNAARGQGAGRLVMDYFARFSEPPPAALFPTLG